MKKKDGIVFGIIAVLLLISLMFYFLHGESGQSMLKITVDQTVYGIYTLDEDQIISINDTNQCEIRDGKVRMIQANCPDHLCMEFKSIDSQGGTIVCLPNRIVLEIVDQSENTVQPDQVAG